ncbi:hypothetical protein [Bosea vaviloviae]|uniref:hypothetical protein n=1 Tax=Bosea vaviloviae TaxID=1526658 RepID=UPI0013148331|nr:hypothetical protein [Bosea vaviloviae]
MPQLSDGGRQVVNPDALPIRDLQIQRRSITLGISQLRDAERDDVIQQHPA